MFLKSISVYCKALLTVLILPSNGQVTREEKDAHSVKECKLPFDVCGKSSDTVFQRKIIRGEPAQFGSYSWMAAIGYKVKSHGPFWQCGGSLVTEQYVVTAAHCLDPASLIHKGHHFVPYVVRLGDVNLDQYVSDGVHPIKVDIEKYVYHPQHSRIHKIYDIGLVRLRKKVQFHDMLKPICLPPEDFSVKSFYSAVVTGWGITNLTTKARSTELQEAELMIQELDECRKNITSVFPKAVINTSVICASAPGKDTCQGDSGSPLMVNRNYQGRSQMYLLGVVSYGYSCAKEGYPGVYTKVSYHRKWLLDNMAKALVNVLNLNK